MNVRPHVSQNLTLGVSHFERPHGPVGSSECCGTRCAGTPCATTAFRNDMGGDWGWSGSPRHSATGMKERF